MILLDTNVLYKLVDLDNDKKVDANKLKDFVKHNNCCCSIFTYFEILNSRFSFEDKKRVLNYIWDSFIKIGNEEYIKNEVRKKSLKQIKDEKEFYDKIKLIIGNYIINNSINHIHFFVKSYAYSVVTIYIDRMEKNLLKQKNISEKNLNSIRRI